MKLARTVLSPLITATALMLAAGIACADDDAKLIKKGKKVFNKCKTCHFIDKEKNKVGPHLVGIMGRKVAAVEDFKYSDAMKEADLVWTEENIIAYVTKPKEFMPGNKMVFPGLNKESDREALMAYIRSEMPKQ